MEGWSQAARLYTGHCSGHPAQNRKESLLKDVEEAFKFHMAVLARLLQGVLDVALSSAVAIAGLSG